MAEDAELQMDFTPAACSATELERRVWNKAGLTLVK